MTFREKLAQRSAAQAGRPHGLLGRIILAPWIARRNAPLNDLVFSQLDLSPNDSVLEVGFGGGHLLGRIAAALTSGFAAGLDLSDDMVRDGGRRFSTRIAGGRMELKQGTAESIPWPDGRFSRLCRGPHRTGRHHGQEAGHVRFRVRGGEQAAGQRGVVRRRLVCGDRRREQGQAKDTNAG